LIYCCLCALFGVAVSEQANAATIAFTADKMVLHDPSLGDFDLEYPALYDGSEPYALIKPAVDVVSKQQVKLAYHWKARDTQIKATLNSDDNGTLNVTFDSVPQGMRSAITRWLIPFNFAMGGSWAMDDAQPAALPTTMSDKPEVGHSHENTFKLMDASHKMLKMSVDCPAGQFLQLQDNRHWNWKIFQLQIICNFKASTEPYGFKIKWQTPANATGNAQVKSSPVRVDRYGQPMHFEFPGKVHSDDELIADVQRDEAYYASLKEPQRDIYGGLLDSQQTYGLQSTGFFHVQKLASGRTVLVTPDGNLFFQLGVCAVKPYNYTYVAGREEIYEWLPDSKGKYAAAFRDGNPSEFSFQIANWIRKFGQIEDADFESRVVSRLKKWGFNSYGAFSGDSHQMPSTPSLPVMWQVPDLMGKFPDPYDPKVIAKLDAVFARQINPSANDPKIIGYFLENEQAFGDLPIQLPQLNHSEPAKLALVAMLQDKYQNIAAFNKAWSTNVPDFKVLATIVIAPVTEAAMADMRTFTVEFLHTYFKLICDTFRKYDPNHLLLGNRFLPANASSEDFVGITADYVDVFSINYYTYGIEKNFLRRVSKLAKGKPILLSEWSFGTVEHGLAGGVRDVADQNERGLAYRNYVEQAAALAEVSIVGIQWFSLADQPLTGRWFQKYNGEAMNIGFLDVADRPYTDFMQHVKQTNDQIYDLVLGNTKPYAYANPRFNSRSTKQTLHAPHMRNAIKIDGQFSDWTGRPSDRLGEDNLIMGQSNGQSGADFWVGWDEQNLYVYVVCQDPTPCMNLDTTNSHLWSSDAVELFVGTQSMDKGGAMLPTDRQVVLGANPEIANQWHWYNTVVQPDVQRAVIKHADGKGWTLEAAVAWRDLGLAQTPKAGQRLRFDLAVDESDGGDKRQRQFMYNGNERNSSDRSAWGVLQLVD
jgi:hypothetical protein